MVIARRVHALLLKRRITMVNIRPFKAIRPIKNLAEKVASLPYDVLNSEEARELGDANKYSFYILIRRKLI